MKKAPAAAGVETDLLSGCIPIHEPYYGPRRAWGWCPACAPYTPEQVAALRQEARGRGEFFGSRYHPECAGALLAGWRASDRRRKG